MTLTSKKMRKLFDDRDLDFKSLNLVKDNLT